MSKYMEFHDSQEVHLGAALMAMDSRSVPEWIELSILPQAREEIKPYLDIYAEILKLHEKLDRIEAFWMRPPWYRRWYRRLEDWMVRQWRSIWREP